MKRPRTIGKAAVTVDPPGGRERLRGEGGVPGLGAVVSLHRETGLAFIQIGARQLIEGTAQVLRAGHRRVRDDHVQRLVDRTEADELSAGVLMHDVIEHTGERAGPHPVRNSRLEGAREAAEHAQQHAVGDGDVAGEHRPGGRAPVETLISARPEQLVAKLRHQRRRAHLPARPVEPAQREVDHPRVAPEASGMKGSQRGRSHSSGGIGCTPSQS